jgi:hypothetical protein
MAGRKRDLSPQILVNIFPRKVPPSYLPNPGPRPWPPVLTASPHPAGPAQTFFCQHQSINKPPQKNFIFWKGKKILCVKKIKDKPPRRLALVPYIGRLKKKHKNITPYYGRQVTGLGLDGGKVERLKSKVK